MIIRPEQPEDLPAIHAVTRSAFIGVEHSSQTEAAIVDALRNAGALTLSLVAEQDGRIVGHAAFSPVRIDGRASHWFGLGPVSVLPQRQGHGVGSALINEGLAQLKRLDAEGCVVLGDPGYYARFGFTSDHDLRYDGAPPIYFQSLALSGAPAKGEVAYHQGFEAR
ncbi:GNAT family N-acetyltransferase [Brevundimonas diminuta]|uniref:GNAT family N-acetyltransferase n=1 Tax=Brevundimonas diminuta TaxID=293 RepID=UPI003D04DA07